MSLSNKFDAILYVIKQIILANINFKPAKLKFYIQELNKLLIQFNEMKKMMKNMNNMRAKN